MNRKLFFLVLCVFSFVYSQAQDEPKNAYYISSDISIGNYAGVDIHLNYIHQEKYSFKLGYTANLRYAKSIPDDFSLGLSGLLFFGLNGPTDEFENFTISAGRIYNLNPRGTIRLNLTAGLGYAILTEPVNWQKIDDRGYLEKNYTYDYASRNTVSLSINPKLEFPFTRYFGLSLSPMLQITTDRVYYGVGIGSMIGLLR